MPDNVSKTGSKTLARNLAAIKKIEKLPKIPKIDGRHLVSNTSLTNL